MAWKRDDYPTPQPESATNPPRPAAPSPAPQAVTAEPPRRGDRATIGPSIFIKGDLAGEEDLVIEGRVEGKVDLKQHNVTIGKNGRVKADVFGRVVTVEGEVDGNVFAQEQAVLRQSGAVRGNITAPRVTLEDGSRFKGSIDMEPKDAGRPAAVAAVPAGPRPSESPAKVVVSENQGQANRSATA
jgi:cytoskeletal protein CcmA (bactofilin family)